jgi:hypothetical protein
MVSESDHSVTVRWNFSMQLTGTVEAQIEVLNRLNRMASEELRELELCLDRHPDHLPAAAERVAAIFRKHCAAAQSLVSELQAEE